MARADELPLVTGKQWTESTDQVKKAYLIGIANIVQLQRPVIETLWFEMALPGLQKAR
jgi:hypothetical protein